jgi:mediator of RNA polymerase II transcription subunit 22
MAQQSQEQQTRRPLQTDVVRRTQLDVGLASLQSGAGGSNPAVQPTSKEYLDKVAEDLNRRVDTEVEALANGMTDLLRLGLVRPHTTPLTLPDHFGNAQVGDKDKFKVAQDAWEAECRAEAMVYYSLYFSQSGAVRLTWTPRLNFQVRAAEGLLAISHTLKMVFVLKDDEAAIKDVHKSLAGQVDSEKEDVRKQALEIANELIKGTVRHKGLEESVPDDG